MKVEFFNLLSAIFFSFSELTACLKLASYHPLPSGRWGRWRHTRRGVVSSDVEAEVMIMVMVRERLANWRHVERPGSFWTLLVFLSVFYDHSTPIQWIL